MEKIQALATELNVSVTDLARYALALKHWMDKGQTLEQAIESDRKACQWMAMNAVALSQELKPMAVEWFYQGRA